MFILSIFLGVIVIAVYHVLISGVLKKHPQITSIQALWVSHLTSAIILFFFTYRDIALFLHWPLMYNIIIYSILMMIARMLHYYACSKEDVSDVSIISALTPIYTLIISAFLGYTLLWQEISGILLICLTVFCFFLKPQSKFTYYSLLEPFIKIRKSKALSFAFIATLPPAYAIFFHKEALIYASPQFVTFAIYLLIGLGTLGFHVTLNIIKKPTQIAGFWAYKKAWFYIVIAGGLQVVMILISSYLLLYVQPASLMALVRLALPLQILLSYIFLKERHHKGYKFGLSFLIFIGSYFISQSYT